MANKILYSIKKETPVFIKRTNEKQWRFYITSKPLVFLLEDYTDPFPVVDFLTFRNRSWLLAVESKYVEEEEFAEGYW
jgi:hypothetical protein